jgi:hypothetical protein
MKAYRQKDGRVMAVKAITRIHFANLIGVVTRVASESTSNLDGMTVASIAGKEQPPR